MEERELITLALGNYSTLVAAQWANGTSRFDVHHPTLYRERRGDQVYGGTASINRARRRVPRLLMLDAPHGTTLKEVSEAATDMQGRADEAMQPAEDAQGASLLFTPQQPQMSPEEALIERLARFARRRAFDPEENEDDCAQRTEDSGDDTDDEECFYYYKPRLTNGIEVLAQPTTWQQPHHVDPTQEEEEEHPREGELPTKAMARKMLFKEEDRMVPWWRYITTGLDVESITTLKPLQHVDASGDVASMHCFGYGLEHFRSNASEECALYTDALRRQLEDADRLQGVQCFVEADSLFGGAAHNVLEDLWEEAGDKVPVTVFSLFAPLPTVLMDPIQSAGIAFADRRVDEAKLNRLLATSLLSAHPSVFYVPLEIGQWASFFGKPQPATGAKASRCWWIDDDTATAQYVAAMADTALYGTRDGGLPASVNPSEASVGESKGPAYYLQEVCRTLRPIPSMRIVSMMGSMPMRLHDARRQDRDLWNFLKDTPLLPLSTVTPHHGGFLPLSHTIGHSASSEAGRVVGHLVSLRGAGGLPSQVYTASEAMLRYALPLRTSTYLPLLTRTNYPVSRTFPVKLLFEQSEDQAAMQRQLPEGTNLSNVLTSVDVGTHLLNTSNAAPMLANVVKAAQGALRYKEHVYSQSYGLEKDSWRERLEDVLQMNDDYRREDEPNDDDDDDDDGA